MIKFDGYALIFKEHILYYCQKIDDSISFSTLRIFLQESLEISSLEVEENLHFSKTHKHHFFKSKKSNLLKIFLIYLFSLCMGFYFLDFNKKEEKNLLSKINLTTKEMNENCKFHYLSPEIITLFATSKKYSVEITNLNSKDSVVFFKVQGKQKESIYKFFAQRKEIKIEDMSFDKLKKVYLANATFKILRK